MNLEILKERIRNSNVLVIGADMEGREDGIIRWSKVDPNYIGISDNKLWKNMFGEILDWKKDSFLMKQMENIFGNKKFKITK